MARKCSHDGTLRPWGKHKRETQQEVMDEELGTIKVQDPRSNLCLICVNVWKLLGISFLLLRAPPLPPCHASFHHISKNYLLSRQRPLPHQCPLQYLKQNLHPGKDLQWKSVPEYLAHCSEDPGRHQVSGPGNYTPPLLFLSCKVFNLIFKLLIYNSNVKCLF